MPAIAAGMMIVEWQRGLAVQHCATLRLNNKRIYTLFLWVQWQREDPLSLPVFHLCHICCNLFTAL